MPAIAMTEAQPVALRDMLAEIERRYIEEALTQSEGVIADAARLLSPPAHHPDREDAQI